jgi:TM2 domain-containing membrane protein YozV
MRSSMLVSFALAAGGLSTLPSVPHLQAQGPSLSSGAYPNHPSLGVAFHQDPERGKDPGTATILSVLIPGAGQMYAGATSRGLLVLGGFIAAPVAGLLLSSNDGTLDDLASLFGGPGAINEPLYIGLVVGMGIYIWSIVDAAPTTRRMNRARGLAALAKAPVHIAHVDGRRQVGVKIVF